MVTCVVAIAGYSRKIMGLITFPHKNAIAIYDLLFQPLLASIGLWEQIHIDHGSKFFFLSPLVLLHSFYLYIGWVLEKSFAKSFLSKPSSRMYLAWNQPKNNFKHYAGIVRKIFIYTHAVYTYYIHIRIYAYTQLPKETSPNVYWRKWKAKYGGCNL